MTDDEISVASELPMSIDTRSLSETEQAVLGLLLSAFARTKDEVMRIHKFESWKPEDEPLRRLADAAVTGSMVPLLQAMGSGLSPADAIKATMSGVVVTSFIAGRNYEQDNPTRKD